MYSQQQEIAEELRRLRVAVKKAAQLAERQRVAVEKVDSALRELGDSENYMWDSLPGSRVQGVSYSVNCGNYTNLVADSLQGSGWSRRRTEQETHLN